MKNIEENVARFLALQIFKERKKPFEKFILRCCPPGKKGREVDSFEIHDSFTSDDVAGKAEEILSRAQLDANGMGGTQRYELGAHEQGERTPCARIPFRLRAEEDEWADDGAGDGDGDMKAVVLQQMRHNEAFARIFTTSMVSTMSTMARRMESLDTTLEKMMRQRMDAFEALEEARSQQHDRDIENMMTVEKEARNNKVFDKIMLLVPAVINKLAGQKVMNMQDPLVMSMKALAESLTPDQLQGIAKNLAPEQQIVLVQLLQTVRGGQLPSGGNGTT